MKKKIIIISLVLSIMVIGLGINVYLDNRTYLFEDKILDSNNIKEENIDKIKYTKSNDGHVHEYIIEDKSEVDSIIDKLSTIEISKTKEINSEGDEIILMTIYENNERALGVEIYIPDYISIFKYKNTRDKIENYKIK